MSCGSTAVDLEDDDECWAQLEDYRLLLIKTIEPSRITPYLRQCKVLSSEDEEQIYNDPNLVIRRRKVGVLLDILQRTGFKGYVAFLESLELDYPQLYRKITGKEPARVFSILVDTAGESGLTQFLMNEVARLQKLTQDERKARHEAALLVAKHEDTIRQMQVRESELRKQQERVQRLREERDQLWEEVRHLKDENYSLMRDVTRLSEEKNSALMGNRDLQLEIERLKHSLMNAESDSMIHRKRTMTLKNAMEQRPSPDMIWQLQKQNDLLKARIQELESDSQVTPQTSTEHEKLTIQSLEKHNEQREVQHQELVNELYTLRRKLHEAEALRDQYLQDKDVLEITCTVLKKDSQMYRDRLEDVLKQMDEIIRERDKAISYREEYHKENSKHLKDKDQYRKQIREMGEQCDELQVQLFRTQGEVLALQTRMRRQQYSSPVSSEDSSLPSSFEENMICEDEPPVTNRPRERCNFYYIRKRALRTKCIKTKESSPFVLRNSSGSDTDGM
ncbi:caspase recruitment domain-containing protein 9 [Chanos chanos]|uniref:Caspase recruitment domain-containing protein 9 n=1 Tax=Chanos chanos TaxID=29144 RepID=A0A6J2WTX6_CHACN|nr:caspase recruitment domain-containing protein 9 [Chanos chanos]